MFPTALVLEVSLSSASRLASKALAPFLMATLAARLCLIFGYPEMQEFAFLVPLLSGAYAHALTVCTLVTGAAQRAAFDLPVFTTVPSQSRSDFH
ncbi:unnamed protein product, partial [Prorocentrum cordatum]